jgi:SAM-dependent methyltransferase
LRLARIQRAFVFPEDVDSTISENEGRALAELARDRVVLELGAWLGRSTVCIAQTAAQLVSVDLHRGDEHSGKASTLPGFMQSLDRYGLAERVVTVVGRFEDVLPLLAPASFDLVFLDGFHSYEQVSADIGLARRLVKPGGAMAFHDYGVDEFGVTRAVDEAFGQPSQIVDTLAVVNSPGGV